MTEETALRQTHDKPTAEKLQFPSLNTELQNRIEHFISNGRMVNQEKDSSLYMYPYSSYCRCKNL